MSSDNFYVVRRDPTDGQWVLSMGFVSDDHPNCKTPLNAADPRYRTETQALTEGFRRHSEYGVSTTPWCLSGHGHATGCHETGCHDTGCHGTGCHETATGENDDQPAAGDSALHAQMLERCLSERYLTGEHFDEQAGECPYYRPVDGPLGADWGVIVNPQSARFTQLVFEHDDCGCPSGPDGWKHP